MTRQLMILPQHCEKATAVMALLLMPSLNVLDYHWLTVGLYMPLHMFGAVAKKGVPGTRMESWSER